MITMPMANKPGRVVTHNEEPLPIKSQDPSITHSCEVTSHIHVISPTALDQRKPNMSQW